MNLKLIVQLFVSPYSIQKLDDANPEDIIMTLGGFVWAIFTSFAYCEIGERVTQKFNRFDDELRHCHWYLYPIELQRLILIILSVNQQSVVIHGYANTVCTRAAFKKVGFIDCALQRTVYLSIFSLTHSLPLSLSLSIYLSIYLTNYPSNI